MPTPAMPTPASALAPYWAKRDFAKTPEPRGEQARRGKALSFVIQKHAATRLHYDFRLELDGVMLSWAVPKGPSLDPADKRMAVRTEDHPLSYASFEGTIPPGQYGAGTVIVWDRGAWEPVGDPHQGLAQGKLAFKLQGEKLAGLWELVRLRKPGEKETWLLFKKRDDHARARADYDVVTALPDSVNAQPTTPAASSVAEAPQPEPVGAVEAPLPAQMSPQLATPVAALPPGDWLFEVKLDGYRVMTRIEQGRPQLITRGGHDWTAKMPELAQALAELGIDSAWLDGEIVVMGADGLPSFGALQNAFDAQRSRDIVYFVFDMPYLGGLDLRAVPLSARRELVQQLMASSESDNLRFSAAFEASARNILESACRMKLEGVIAKRRDAPYESRRTGSWLKLKCHPRQEFVIGGFTERTGAPSEVGSLLLGVHDTAGRLLFSGRVGTGWDAKTSRELRQRLETLRVDSSPFDGDRATKKGRWSAARPAGREHWVRPQLVAEITFAGWTADDQVRQGKFEGLRTDRPARSVTREEAAVPAPAPARGAAVAASAPAAAHGVSGVKVSHPERVIDPASGTTKLDLVRYYESVARWILPHLQGRPCSLMRAPAGISGQLFFQKHLDKLRIPGVQALDPALWPGHEALLTVETAQALAGAAQMNVVEFHTWNATAARIGQPDRMVFDLDPGEGVAWAQVQEAAVLTRALLQELGLQSWLKTSGGKGLHVVVPLAPRYGWDAVKGFSQAVVQHLARTIPERFVAKSGSTNRVGKVFADYLRNGLGATTVAAYSARARPGLGVSMPVSWEQLDSLKSGAHWTVGTAREYLSFHPEDLWADFWTTKQALARPMKALGYRPPP